MADLGIVVLPPGRDVGVEGLPPVNLPDMGPGAGGAGPGGIPSITVDRGVSSLDATYTTTREALQASSALVDGLPPIPTANEYHATLPDGTGRTYGDAVAAQAEAQGGWAAGLNQAKDIWVNAPVWAYFDSLANLTATGAEMAAGAKAAASASPKPDAQVRAATAGALEPILRDMADYYAARASTWQPQTGAGGFAAEAVRYGAPNVAAMMLAPQVKAAQVAPKVIKAINTGLRLASGVASDFATGYTLDNPARSIQNSLRNVDEAKLLEAAPTMGRALLTIKRLSAFLALPDEAYDEAGEIKPEWMAQARTAMASEQALTNPVGELIMGAAKLVNTGIRRIVSSGLTDQTIGAGRRAQAVADEMLSQDPSLRTKSSPEYEALRELQALGLVLDAATTARAKVKPRIKGKGRSRGDPPLENKAQKKQRETEEFEQYAGWSAEMVEQVLKNIQKQGKEGGRNAAEAQGLKSGTEAAGELPVLQQRLPEAGLAEEGAMQGVRQPGQSDASSGLQPTVPGGVDVPPVSSGVTSGKPPELVFNLDRLATPDDVKGFINQTAEQHRPEIDAYRRGVRTHSDEMRDADLLGMSVAGVQKLTALKADEMLAARQTLVTMAEQIQGLARKAAASEGTDLDMVQLRQAMTAYVAVQQHVKGLQTETARTLSAMRIAATRTTASARAVEQFLGEWGGRDANKRLAENLAGINDLAEVGAVTARAWNATTWDMMMEARKMGSLLTSPMTHMMNAASNATTTVTGVGEHLVAAGVSSLRRAFSGGPGPLDPADAIFLRESIAGVWGMWAGVGDAFKNAWHAVKTGEGKDGTAWKVDQGFRRAITAENVKRTWWGKAAQRMLPSALAGEGAQAWRAFDYLGEAMRGSGRAILSIDEFFKTINYSAEIHRQAMRTALTTEGASLGVTYRQAIENPAPEVAEKAVAYAQDQTFSSPPAGKMAQLMSTVRASDPSTSVGWKIMGGMVDLVIPFKTAPVNIVKYTFERTPGFNMLIGRSRDDILGRNGKAAQDMAIAKLAVGSSVLGIFAWQASQGRITGGGPLDTGKRMQLEERTGWRPYSIIMDDGTTVALQRLGPIGQLMGISADMTEVWSELDQKDRDQLAVLGSVYSADMMGEGLNAMSAFGHGAMRNTLDQSPLLGVRDFIGLLSDISAGHGTSGTKSFASKIAASFVPFSGATNYLTYWTENGQSRNPAAAPLDEFGRRQSLMAMTLRETLQRAKAKIPGLSKDVPARLGFWGQQIYRAPYAFEGLLPFQAGDLKTDPAKLEALNLPANPALWTDIAYPYTIDADRLGRFIDTVGVDGELVRLGMPVGDHPKKIQGIPLDATQELKYRRAVNELTGVAPIIVGGQPFDISGLTMREALEDLVRQPWYVGAPEVKAAEEDKASMLNSVVDHYRHRLGGQNEYGLGGADRLLFEADNRFASSVERRLFGLERLKEDADLQSILGGAQ